MSFSVSTNNPISSQREIEQTSDNKGVSQNSETVFKKSMSEVTGKLLTDVTNIKKRVLTISHNTEGKSLGEAIKQVLKNICEKIALFVFDLNPKGLMNKEFSEQLKELKSLTERYAEGQPTPGLLKDETEALKEAVASLKKASSHFTVFNNSGKYQLGLVADFLSKCIRTIKTKDALPEKSNSELREIVQDTTGSQTIKQTARQILEERAAEIRAQLSTETENNLREMVKDTATDPVKREVATQILTKYDALVGRKDDVLRKVMNDLNASQLEKGMANKILKDRAEAREELSTKTDDELREIKDNKDSNMISRQIAHEILSIHEIPNIALHRIREGISVSELPGIDKGTAVQELLRREAKAANKTPDNPSAGVD